MLSAAWNTVTPVWREVQPSVAGHGQSLVSSFVVFCVPCFKLTSTQENCALQIQSFYSSIHSSYILHESYVGCQGHIHNYQCTTALLLLIYIAVTFFIHLLHHYTLYISYSYSVSVCFVAEYISYPCSVWVCAL